MGFPANHVWCPDSIEVVSQFLGVKWGKFIIYLRPNRFGVGLTVFLPRNLGNWSALCTPEFYSMVRRRTCHACTGQCAESSGEVDLRKVRKVGWYTAAWPKKQQSIKFYLFVEGPNKIQLGIEDEVQQPHPGVISFWLLGLFVAVFCFS